jgi:hypothetical protein
MNVLTILEVIMKLKKISKESKAHLHKSIKFAFLKNEIISNFLFEFFK